MGGARVRIECVVWMMLFALVIPFSAFARQEHGRGDAGGAMSGDVNSTATRLTTFTTDDFSGSGVCAFCHGGLLDSKGVNVSIDGDWRSTMMANSGKDPLWQAKLFSEVGRNLELKAVIEERCSRCHMGMARYQAVTNGSPVKVVESGFLEPDHPLHEAALDGVSCSLCHQIENTNLGTPDSYTGQYRIDTSTSPPDRVAFGPYERPVQQPMEMHAGFTPAPGVQAAESSLCGSCHTLYTPIFDPAAKKVVGEFPEQTTYLEWKHSAKGGGVGLTRTCQGCHMPSASGSSVLSNRPRWLSEFSPFWQHHFVGGNAFMLGLLESHGAEVGLTADGAQMDATITRTITQLQTGTATLSVTSASIDGSNLTAKLTVQNKTGHKFPSGVPVRRAWLHVTVKDGLGNTIFESGKPEADGRIAGNDADEDESKYEPHYDCITSPQQVQIYEAIMRDTAGGVTYTFVQATDFFKDNRLLPSGFDKATASSDIAVVGTAEIEPNFAAGQDQITYVVNVAGKRMPIMVSAELLYQPVSYRFVQDLKRDGVSRQLGRFAEQYRAADKSPVVVGSVQKAVK